MTEGVGMDKEKNKRNAQIQSESEDKPRQLVNLDEYETFTDKKRKREEIKNSTIGGF